MACIGIGECGLVEEVENDAARGCRRDEEEDRGEFKPVGWREGKVGSSVSVISPVSSSSKSSLKVVRFVPLIMRF